MNATIATTTPKPGSQQQVVGVRSSERRSAGQVLKDFDEMMETIKSWLPPTVIMPPPKPRPWKLETLWPEDKHSNDEAHPRRPEAMVERKENDEK